MTASDLLAAVPESIQKLLRGRGLFVRHELLLSWVCCCRCCCYCCNRLCHNCCVALSLSTALCSHCLCFAAQSVCHGLLVTLEGLEYLTEVLCNGWGSVAQVRQGQCCSSMLLLLNQGPSKQLYGRSCPWGWCVCAAACWIWLCGAGKRSTQLLCMLCAVCNGSGLRWSRAVTSNGLTSCVAATSRVAAGAAPLACGVLCGRCWVRFLLDPRL